MASETERARLINDISVLLREPKLPESTRTAGLTLIGWLARRMPGECAHAIGVCEARQAVTASQQGNAKTLKSSMSAPKSDRARRKSER